MYTFSCCEREEKAQPAHDYLLVLTGKEEIKRETKTLSAQSFHKLKKNFLNFRTIFLHFSSVSLLSTQHISFK